jgi:hypothetical protein
MGGGVPGFPATIPPFCIDPDVALFEDVDDIKAALPARYGMKAAVGLAISNISFVIYDEGFGWGVKTSQGH